MPITSLVGTIPITYRNATYNIPIAVRVLPQYPQRAPDIFVTPTPNMVVKPSQHVDERGRVYHPNLAYWASRPDVSGDDSRVESVDTVDSGE